MAGNVPLPRGVSVWGRGCPVGWGWGWGQKSRWDRAEKRRCCGLFADPPNFPGRSWKAASFGQQQRVADAPTLPSRWLLPSCSQPSVVPAVAAAADACAARENTRPPGRSKPLRCNLLLLVIVVTFSLSWRAQTAFCLSSPASGLASGSLFALLPITWVAGPASSSQALSSSLLHAARPAPPPCLQLLDRPPGFSRSGGKPGPCDVPALHRLAALACSIFFNFFGFSFSLHIQRRAAKPRGVQEASGFSSDCETTSCVYRR